ncbi:MAG: SO_0444 family Cu/Zn efflux transporter [Candidatus Zophobacter franzmannii]|nr:SO_0444 family Cu/Zn efflux transporter [Candidatus Zophobacter franzmannii]
MSKLNAFFPELLTVYMELAPYLFIGLAFVGILHLIIKDDWIGKQLGNNKFSAVLKAALVGVPMPLCSCGVIPTALHINKQGASKGATVSFLISTPQTGIDSITPTIGMLGPVFGIFRPFWAFLSGIVGGVITNLFVNKRDQAFEDKPIESSCSSSSCSTEKPAKKSWKDIFKYAFVEFLDDISPQLIVGIVLAALIALFVPENFFQTYGKGFTGMAIIIIFGLPLYVCATGSIPIAISLMLKGFSPGAAFVFLTVGPATNIATISMVMKALGTKIMLIYLGSITAMALLGGFVLNLILDTLKVDMNLMLMDHPEMDYPMWQIILTILFSITLMFSIYRRVAGMFSKKGQSHSRDGDCGSDSQDATDPTNETILTIEGMTCSHCVKHVKESIEEVPGVSSADVSLAGKSAIISGDYNLDDVKYAVTSAGYKIK